MARLVSVDVGNGYTKAVSSTACETFPSVVALEQGALSFDSMLSANGHDLVIDVAGERYALGKSAYKLGRMQTVDQGRDRIEGPSYKRLYLGALVSVARASGELAVVASLPVSWWEASRETARQVLAGDYGLKVQGRRIRYRVQPENVHIVPEGFGAICFEVLDSEGGVVYADLARQRVGVVDVGTYTTDLLFFDSLEIYPSRCAGDRLGMANLWQLVSEQVSKRHNRDLSIHEVDQAIHQGYIRKGPHQLDISGEIERAAGALADSVRGLIASQWSGGDDVDVLIMVGGASPLIAHLLPFPHVMLSGEPVLANVEGAFRFGLMRGFADE